MPGAIVCYESPHRVAATLASVAEVMPGRRVALVRELTKLHEEVVRDEAAALAAAVAAREEIRGECVIVIAPPTAEDLEERRRSAAGAGAALTLEEAIREGLAAGEPKSALAKRLAKELSVPRAEVYDQVVAAAAPAEP